MGKKLDPVTVTLVPIGPLVGLRLREEPTTPKVAEAAFGMVSPAYTVCALFAELGTVNVQENAPVPLLITVVGNVVSGKASKFKDITWVGSKFDPVTVTVVPLEPLVGFKVMARVITVKVPV